MEKRDGGSQLAAIIESKRAEAEEVLADLLDLLRRAGVTLPSACLDRQERGFTGNVLLDLGRIRVDHARTLCGVLRSGLDAGGPA
ncbi:hypothetical protein C7C46_30425 [Streptomyces tateyamensis]|uniref:Uncharacterized protein n=1 Tax=Streptomyces tateyamensis TaxID=565073 RepID=A0A2V4NIJ4_9ACTN|nr:hypothetical protein [Streptomyces tateyamensis]PYC67364.1 hypothetical protein C7C46_30425 [Streptomyces tateyamensis]